MRVTLPDGTEILAQGRLDLVPSDRPREPDFALYLDGRWDDDPTVTWGHIESSVGRTSDYPTTRGGCLRPSPTSTDAPEPVNWSKLPATAASVERERGSDAWPCSRVFLPRAWWSGSESTITRRQ